MHFDEKSTKHLHKTYNEWLRIEIEVSKRGIVHISITGK